MRRPTDDEIARALCCGDKCAVGPNTGKCHRWDFETEVARVRALLELVNAAKEKEAAEQIRLAQRSVGEVRIECDHTGSVLERDEPERTHTE